MLPKTEYFDGGGEVLDVVLHGSTKGMGSEFIQKIFAAGKNAKRSIVIFDFPYMARGEEKLMNQPRIEEIEALKSVIKECKGENFKKIRLIGKSLGAVIAGDYLVGLTKDEQKKYELVILGYDLGWIKIQKFPGKITVIQGGRDPYGNLDEVNKDLAECKSKDISLFEIGGADHSYNDPETNTPKYVDMVLELLFKNNKVEKEKPGGGIERPVHIENVVQKADYDCGAAALSTLMILVNKRSVLESNLERRIGTTPEAGTSPKNIKMLLAEEEVEYVEGRNLKFEDIERFVQEGFVCLVTYQAWWSEEEKDNLLCGHYSIVFDIDDKFVWLIDPGIEVETEPGAGIGVVKKERSDFDKRWIDREESGEIYNHWMIGVKPIFS